MSQTQITKLEMMPISFAVSRNVDEIPSRRGADKLLDESAARRKCTFESNRAREWSIVKEDCERTAGSVRVTKEIRLGSIDDALPLVRREDHVTHALFDEKREHLIVGGSFRQPERFRFTTEAITKIS